MESDQSQNVEDGRSYAELLASVLDGQPSWHEQELGQILGHMLDVPLGEVLDAAAHESDMSVTFADILNNPSPSATLLQDIKVYAKRCRSDPESPLPPTVATALYFSALAAAQLRCQRRITQLSVQQLMAGLEWLTRCDWAPQMLRDLAEQALNHLRRSESHLLGSA